MSIRTIYQSVKDIGKFVVKHPKASLELLAIGLTGLLGEGCASQLYNRVVEKPIHPNIEVVESGLDIRERKLERMVSKSITIQGTLHHSRNIAHNIVEEFQEEIGEPIVVRWAITDFIDNSYLLTNDRSLDLYLFEDVYSNDELKQVLIDNNIGYIEASKMPTSADSLEQDNVMYFIMTKEGSELFQQKVKEVYPHRLSELTEKFYDEFEQLQTEKRAELIDRINSNDDIFISMQGDVSPLEGVFNYKYLNDETRLNVEALDEFFSEKDYTIFHVTRNEEKFNTLLELIKENSNENTNLVIFYNGHGIEKGLSLFFGSVIESQEIERSLDGFIGTTTLFVNSCFSGNIRAYFEERNSNVTVVSASKNGSILSSSGFNQPGYLIQDFLKSGMDMDNFGKNFRDIPENNYHPRIYRPSD